MPTTTLIITATTKNTIPNFAFDSFFVLLSFYWNICFYLSKMMEQKRSGEIKRLSPLCFMINCILLRSPLEYKCKFSFPKDNQSMMTWLVILSYGATFDF